MITVNIKYRHFFGKIDIHEVKLHNDIKQYKRPVLGICYSHDYDTSNYYLDIPVSKFNPFTITFQNKTYTLDNEATLLLIYHNLSTLLALDNL